MAKSLGKSPTGSLVPSGGPAQPQNSSPRTGTESTLKLKTGSKQFGDKMDKTKLSGFGKQQYPPVLDENGLDVTPKPLEKRSFIDVPIKTTSALIGAMDTPSSLLEHPGRSKFVSMQRTSMMSMLESLFDEEAFIVAHSARQEIQEEPPSEESLIPSNLPANTMIQMVLTETETNFLFELEGLVIQADTEEAELITKKNEAYKKLCIAKEGSDSYTDRPAQTVALPPKTKAIQTTSLGLKDVGSEVNGWLMFDTYLAEDLKIEEIEAKRAASQLSLSDAGDLLYQEHSYESINEIFKDAVSDGGGDSLIAHSPTMLSPAGGSGNSKLSNADESTRTVPIEASAAKSETLKKNLFIMERMINLNLFQKSLAIYKHFEVLEEPVYVIRKMEDSLFYDEEEIVEEAPPETNEIPDKITIKKTLSVAHWEIEDAYTLVNLWSFFSPKLAGFAVNCIDIIPNFPDLIGVGYGDIDFSSSRPGYAACWSLKNLRHPERILETKLGVTAISFSKRNPALLAVGLHDGTIMLGLVKEENNKWIMDSSDSNELHIGPIWKLLWILRKQGSGGEKSECLLSACEDAHICQWYLRKGMESVTIMRVKQTANANAHKKEKNPEVSVAKHATVFCIDFHPTRENIYLVGTGEGCIHECSITNSDHFITTYLGHTAPVYQVSWSPFAEEIFLSCGADWSIRAWISGEENSAMVFQATPSIVINVCWSPINSSIFAAIHEHQVEVWDLTFSTMDPVAVYELDMEMETEFSMLAFNKAGDALLVGDKTGRVSALGLQNFPPAPPPEKQIETLAKLVETVSLMTKKIEVVDEEELDI